MGKAKTKFKSSMAEAQIEHRKNTMTWKQDWQRNKGLYFFVIPVIVYYIVFEYFPSYGMVIGFKEYSPGLGIWGSPWVGFDHLVEFFEYPYVGRLFRNTIFISICDVIVMTPIPIIFALFLNELRFLGYKKFLQTVTIFPNFVSAVVTATVIHNFCKTDGLFNTITGWFGLKPRPMLAIPELFVPIYQIMNIWKGTGWSAVFYIAIMSALDPELYEAADIDGCGRLGKMWHVTLPGIKNALILQFIMRMGGLFSVSSGTILLLYNPGIYERADVISTYLYRKGLEDFDFSYSACINLFNSLINMCAMIITNSISKRVSQTSLF